MIPHTGRSMLSHTLSRSVRPSRLVFLIPNSGQNSLMFWKLGGENIKIYGEGVLNGNGQRWWNEFSGLEILDPDNEYLRPVLFYAQNVTGLEVEGIHLKD